MTNPAAMAAAVEQGIRAANRPQPPFASVSRWADAMSEHAAAEQTDRRATMDYVAKASATLRALRGRLLNATSAGTIDRLEADMIYKRLSQPWDDMITGNRVDLEPPETPTASDWDSMLAAEIAALRS